MKQYETLINENIHLRRCPDGPGPGLSTFPIAGNPSFLRAGVDCCMVRDTAWFEMPHGSRCRMVRESGFRRPDIFSLQGIVNC